MALQAIYSLTLAVQVMISLAQVYKIDTDTNNTITFDGLGGISGGGATSKLLNTYPEKYRADLYDLLFKPNFGASLQILKVEMGGGAQTTEGTELSHMPNSSYSSLNTNSYEWIVLKEAKKRNPDLKLIGLPWSFPGWVSDGKQNPFIHPDRLSRYFISWLDLARKSNLTIDYLGIWNEPPDMLISDIANFTKYLRQKLDMSAYEHVKLIIGETRQWNITESLLADKDLYTSVDILSSHYPGEESDPSARSSGKTLWASEDYSTTDNGHGAACLARVINRNFVNGGMTSTIAWNMIASYYNSLPYPQAGLMTANQPWSGHYTISPPVWVMAHTTQFTDVGWQYLSAGSGSFNLKSGGTIVTYINPYETELTIVIETMSHKISECVRPHTPPYNISTQNITLMLTGVISHHIDSLRYWHSKITSNSQDCTMMIRRPDIAVISGVVSLGNIPENCLITLTTLKSGQKGKPKSDIPSGKLFPLTYSDDFEPKYGDTVGSEPRYLTPQTGTFQLGRFRDRSVLLQTTDRAPVEFCSTTPYKKAHFPVKVSPVAVMPFNPWAYPGHNYSISVEVAIDSRNSDMTLADAGVFLALYMDQGGCHVPLSNGLFFVFNISGDSVGGVFNKMNFTHENLINKFEYPFLFKYDQFVKISVVVINSFIDNVSMNGIAVLAGLDIPKSYHGGLLGLGCNGFYKCMYDNLEIHPLLN